MSGEIRDDDDNPRATRATCTRSARTSPAATAATAVCTARATGTADGARALRAASATASATTRRIVDRAAARAARYSGATCNLRSGSSARVVRRVRALCASPTVEGCRAALCATAAAATTGTKTEQQSSPDCACGLRPSITARAACKPAACSARCAGYTRGCSTRAAAAAGGAHKRAERT